MIDTLNSETITKVPSITFCTGLLDAFRTSCLCTTSKLHGNNTMPSSVQSGVMTSSPLFSICVEVWHVHNVQLNGHWSCVSTVCSHTVAVGSSCSFTHIKVLSLPTSLTVFLAALSMVTSVINQSSWVLAVSEEASICLGHLCCVSCYKCLGVNTPFAWWTGSHRKEHLCEKKTNSTSPNVLRVSFYIVK